MAGPERGLDPGGAPYWRQYGGPGFSLVERAETTIAADGMLVGGETVVVAVSGGPDSACLLDVLARLGRRLQLTLVVAHVDHGLSEESSKIAARVAKEAAEAGFEVHLARPPDLEGSNLHARARDFRYEFFDIVAEREGADRIATGHTLDDRVETTLARLVHGSGTAGLAGLTPVEGKRIRPLIGSRRSETRAYCEERTLAFFDDPANVDLRFERAAVRAKLVRAIEEHWGDGAVRSVARSAARLREDADALANLSERLHADLATDTDEGIRIELESMLALPRALRRRILELAVGRVRDRAGGIDAALDALDESKEGRGDGARFAVASGIEIVHGADHLLVSKLT